MRILIAEDDLTSRKMLSAVLIKNGYDVLEVENGQAAMETLLEPDAPKLAILDWMMPKMDGVSVIQRVRALPDEKRPYIILLTTRNEQDDIITGLQAGADDYICKPFVLGELKARVHVGRRMIELQERLAHQVVKLNKALKENKILQGIIPICMYCKKIRDDQGFWAQVESYVSKYSPAEFSHSICPSCMSEHFPDVDDDS